MPGTRSEFIRTRTSLLSRLKSWDDQESWKEFFDIYWKLLYSVAIKSGLSDAVAQDVVQDTIVAVAKRMGGFKYDPALGSFKAWLGTIIRRRIIDYFRKSARLPRSEDPPRTGNSTPLVERIADPAAVPLDRIWEEEWHASIFEAALERIKRQTDPKQFQIFDCYALKQWPVAEVAHSLHVTPSQVYVTKHRFTALLKEEVKKLETTML